MKNFLVRCLCFPYNTGIVALLLTVSAASVSGEALAPVVEATSIQEKRNSLIESRLIKLERLMENQVIMNLSLRLDELENQLQQLQGDIELQTHKQEDMERRQRALYLDLDQRLEALETASDALEPKNSDLPVASDENLSLSAAPESDEMIPGAILVTAADAVSEVAEPPSQGFTSSSDPALDYSEAYSLLKNGQYDEAINAFQNFLKNHPDTEYADNAQYWLGEANYVTRRFSQAVNEFGKVVSDYSTSHKVPGALLKIGYAHYELDEWSQARSSLESLVSQFPASSAARLAENRLKRMEEEGR